MYFPYYLLRPVKLETKPLTSRLVIGFFDHALNTNTKTSKSIRTCPPKSGKVSQNSAWRGLQARHTLCKVDCIK